MFPRPGWSVHTTSKSFSELVSDLKSAIKVEGFSVVTQAGPTGAAKKRGITIPGNRVIGVFNNHFAVRVLNLSTAAMIEASIRFYVTESKDNTATLSYKLPTTVFSPYFAEAGHELVSVSNELDTAFNDIALSAIK